VHRAKHDLARRRQEEREEEKSRKMRELERRRQQRMVLAERLENERRCDQRPTHRSTSSRPEDLGC
jgi:hypothetical protein